MLKSKVKRCWGLIKQNPALAILLLSAAAYFFIYYVTDPLRPANMIRLFGFHDVAVYPQGWFGYYDQSQYLRLAHTLANFDFHQLHETYTYGVGYPLVAVPFIWLGFGKDPFIFFNLLTFVFATYATYRVAKTFTSPLAGFLAGFGLVFASPLIHYVDQPWNSTVCLFAMSAILIITTVKKITKWHALIVGLLVGWVFAARYVDVIWMGPIGLASLYRGSFRILTRQTIAVLIGFCILVLPVMYSQYKVFGSPFRTPYVNHLGVGQKGGSDQSLHAYSLKRVPSSGLALGLSPRLAGSPDIDRGLLIDMFWVLAAIPGAIILLKRSSRKLFFSCLIGGMVLASIFYLSFRASTPSSLKYGELHYFKMFWPGLAVFAAVYLDYLLNFKSKPKTRNRV